MVRALFEDVFMSAGAVSCLGDALVDHFQTNATSLTVAGIAYITEERTDLMALLLYGAVRRQLTRMM